MKQAKSLRNLRPTGETCPLQARLAWKSAQDAGLGLTMAGQVPDFAGRWFSIRFRRMNFIVKQMQALNFARQERWLIF